MNPLHERYSDLIGEQDDPALLACVADLDTTCATFTLPPERDDALARSLMVEASNASSSAGGSVLTRRMAFPVPWRAARWRLASAVLAVLVAGSGIGSYLHGQSPTPVDAQTVLHRAAAVSPGPNQATHATYQISAGGDVKGTADAWVGFDGTGAPNEFALAETIYKDGSLAPDMSARMNATGVALRQAYALSPGPIKGPASDSPGKALEGILAGTLLAQKLSRQPDAYKLQQEMLNGVPVYALLDATTGQTYYFNTQTYVLEGADWLQNGTTWQVRLNPASYQTMALSAVPAHTFPATADGGATVSQSAEAAIPRSTETGGVKVGPPALSNVVGGVGLHISKGGPAGSDATLKIGMSLDGQTGPGVDITAATVAACNTTSQAFASAVMAGDQSLLAVCQETNPGMTADRLVAALMTPVTSALDAQVASGAITSAQESSELVNVRTKITQMVTSRMGAGGPGATVHQSPSRR